MRIPEIKLKMELTEESEDMILGFKWAGEDIGKRSKIGGNPTWIQPEEDIVCAECGEKMTFYAQIDSINDDIIIADCGMIYIFICFDCYEVKAFVHSY